MKQSHDLDYGVLQVVALDVVLDGLPGPVLSGHEFTRDELALVEPYGTRDLNVSSFARELHHAARVDQTVDVPGVGGHGEAAGVVHNDGPLHH